MDSSTDTAASEREGELAQGARRVFGRSGLNLITFLMPMVVLVATMTASLFLAGADLASVTVPSTGGPLADGVGSVAETRDSATPPPADAPSGQAARNSNCVNAIENFDYFVQRNRVGNRVPYRVTVPNVDIAKLPDDETTAPACRLAIARRSGPAGVAALLVALLTGAGVLSALVIGTRLRPEGRLGSLLVGSMVALLVVGVGFLLAGVYQRHKQMLLLYVAVGVGLAISVAVAHQISRRARTADTASLDDAITRLGELRFDTRLVVSVFAVLLSLTVAVLAAFNARDIEETGALRLDLPMVSTEIGGLDASTLDVVTSVQGAVFAAIAFLLAAPAILESEQYGQRVVDRFRRASPTPDSLPTAPPESPLDERARIEELAGKLGIRTRPAQWIEHGISVLLPLLTGVSADFLGLF